MRVTSGTLKGRKLTIPEGRDIRPTKGIAKESLFNMLRARANLANVARAVDLFAGVGSLGLEALSNGVRHVTFVDPDPRPAYANATAMDVEPGRFTTQRADAGTFVPAEPFDVILADPPYGEGWVEKLLTRKDELGKAGTLWALEMERHATYSSDGFEVLKDKTFGKSKVVLLLQK